MNFANYDTFRWYLYILTNYSFLLRSSWRIQIITGVLSFEIRQESNRLHRVYKMDTFVLSIHSLVSSPIPSRFRWHPAWWLWPRRFMKTISKHNFPEKRLSFQKGFQMTKYTSLRSSFHLKYFSAWPMRFEKLHRSLRTFLIIQILKQRAMGDTGIRDLWNRKYSIRLSVAPVWRHWCTEWCHCRWTNWTSELCRVWRNVLLGTIVHEKKKK